MSVTRKIFHYAIMSSFLEGFQVCICLHGCFLIMEQSGGASYHIWKDLQPPAKNEITKEGTRVNGVEQVPQHHKVWN